MAARKSFTADFWVSQKNVRWRADPLNSETGKSTVKLSPNGNKVSYRRQFHGRFSPQNFTIVRPDNGPHYLMGRRAILDFLWNSKIGRKTFLAAIHLREKDRRLAYHQEIKQREDGYDVSRRFHGQFSPLIFTYNASQCVGYNDPSSVIPFCCFKIWSLSSPIKVGKIEIDQWTSLAILTVLLAGDGDSIVATHT